MGLGSFLLILSASVAGTSAQRCVDRCGNAIISNRPVSVAESLRRADCTSALASLGTVTVTPTTTSTATLTVSTTDTATLTATVTLTSTSVVTTETIASNGPARRAVPILSNLSSLSSLSTLSSSLPAYASACTSEGSYESACLRLLGLTAISTVTVTETTLLLTETATSTYVDTETTTDLTTTSTTTTTTTSFSDTSSAAQPSMTLIAGNSPVSYDDNWFSVTLPFPITVYGVSDSTVFISVNGFVFLQDPGGSTIQATGEAGAYLNGPLPNYCTYRGGNVLCINSLPPLSVAPYWSDLFLTAFTSQGLYYRVEGTAPGRTVTFEWYTSFFGFPDGSCNFTAQFPEDAAAPILFEYFEIAGAPAAGNTGLQGQTDTEFAQYSFSQTTITDATLQYDPATNAITQVD